MTAGYHRGIFYWLLLLVPTLAVGSGALWLLRREQARLEEQARVAMESRRSVFEARARLIAENVELAIDGMQTALMTTLQEVPAESPDPFLDDWEKSNPLVRTSFRVGADERVLRRTGNRTSAEADTWLNRWLISAAPWRNLIRQEDKETAAEQRLRGDVTVNVQQAQAARNSLKDFASQGMPSKKAQGPLVAADSTGWSVWRDTTQLHLIGWRRSAAGETIGIELNLNEIARRLGELLPQDGDFADAFVVREAAAGTKRWENVRNGWTSIMRTTDRGTEVTVPIAADVLPGWEVVGMWRDTGSGPNRGFFWIGVLLIGGAVVAIVAGGSLLLWQARRSEAEAAQKTSFVANVSHEFKTPLTTIRLYAELLEQGRVQDAAQGGDYLRTITRETQRLARLVNNALDFSRLEQGKKKYARDLIDFTAELTRLLDTLGPRLAEAGLVLTRVLPNEPLRLTSDRDAVEQIVLNLIDNACKYAVDGGEVTVTLAAGRIHGLEIRVADRGPGVPAEHRERIFEKFHRVDDTLIAEKSGAGLGLSIARQLARGLGGDLRYSPRTGAGAEFILVLP